MHTITKKDYYIAAVAGFFTGLFAIPTLFNLGIHNPYKLALAPVVVPPLWAFGVWLGKFLSRWMPFFAQFGKFAAVGFLSASIDFGTLNIISYMSGVVGGVVIGGVNIPGFTLAVINGYLWNKLWVFKNPEQEESLFHDFPKFLTVTVMGLLLNSGIIITVTTYIPVLFNVSPQGWLNSAKVLANAVVMIWNFLGYKFVVFK